MTSFAAIVIPVRSFASGKTRLRPVLADARRRSLVVSMAERVLEATLDLDVRLLTPDDEVVRWAMARGVPVFRDEASDLNAALEAARKKALDEGSTSVLVLFADLPSVERDDVLDMLSLTAPDGAVIAPDAAGEGTNALHVGPGTPLRYKFGHGSFRAHMAQVPGARIVRRRGLAADVDDPSDL